MTRAFDEAVDRARNHLRNATVEGLEAARAVLDAADVASGASHRAPDSLPGRMHASLGDLIEALRSGRRIGLPTTLARPLLQALESEIARWRARSRSDPDARLVLRAFLGLRELLWELGLEGEAETREAEPHSQTAKTPPRRQERSNEPRVQRFRVED